MKFLERRSLRNVLKNEKVLFQSSKNKNDGIFSLVWNMVYWLLRGPCFEFFGDGKCDNFWAKKLMERWYLQFTETLLFSDFLWWKIRSFLTQKVNGKMIFTDYWKVLLLGYRKVVVLNFPVMGNTIFFQPKRLM